MAQIKKEFEDANLTHARDLAEVREGWKKAKETHKREINEAQSTIHQLEAQFVVVSLRMVPCGDLSRFACHRSRKNLRTRT